MHARKVKLAVSMTPALLRQVKSQIALGRAKSVSAYVEHAVAAQLAAQADFDVLLQEALARTGGAPTAAEKGRSRQLLRGAAT